MTKPVLFNPATHTIGLNRKLEVSKVPERPDPPIPVDGVTLPNRLSDPRSEQSIQIDGGRHVM